jgi:hypothetical protein
VNWTGTEPELFWKVFGRRAVAVRPSGDAQVEVREVERAACVVADQSANIWSILVTSF